jgi:excisionase family DNA binding protein
MLTRQFFSVKDVAELLKVGQVTVRNWVKSGDLRAVDVGREWRIAPKDLEAFLQRHTNRPEEGSALSDTVEKGAERPSAQTAELGKRQQRSNLTRRRTTKGEIS